MWNFHRTPPILGTLRYQAESSQFLSGTIPGESRPVSHAAPVPWPKQSQADLSQADLSEPDLSQAGLSQPGLSHEDGSKAGLHLIWERAPVGIASCTRHGVVSDMNPEFRRMIGCGPNESSAPHLAELIHGTGLPENKPESKLDSELNTERLVAELLEGRRTQVLLEQPRVRPDGKKAWTRWTIWAVSKPDGDPDSAMALAEDVRPTLQGEHRQAEAEQMEAVGRLAGGVAHDFNNLLTGITLYCDLLLASLESGSPEMGHRLRHYVEEIRAAGIQAAGLIRQLLAVASPHGAQPRALVLNEIVESMRNLLTRLIGENIELMFHLDPNLGAINMDPAQAQQILLNLVLNARDAIPGGGQITVETRNSSAHAPGVHGSAKEIPQDSDAPAQPFALLAVSDNGLGMNAQTQGRLFEPFFTTKLAGKNSGLGLSTVHNIVDRNGGLIHVSSAPGRGTQVTVELPQLLEKQIFEKQVIETQPQPMQAPETFVPESADLSQLRLKKNEGDHREREKESTP